MSNCRKKRHPLLMNNISRDTFKSPMTGSNIYADNNATTALDPAIAERMHELYLVGPLNPASQHRRGRQALRLLEDAKTGLLAELGAAFEGMDAAQVILTSGGTEANNLAIRGYALARSATVIVGATEHPSVLDSARALGPKKFRVLPANADGMLDLDVLRQWLREDAASIGLVSVMLGNNETGIIPDLESICQLCREFGVPVHSDAVQAVGKLDVNLTELGLSAVSLTAHKLHGPVGIGALVLLAGEKVDPILLGGGQQLGLRPGTEPVVPAVALEMAVRLASTARRAGVYERLAALRDDFEARLATLCDGISMEIIGRQSPRLPHVSNVAFHGLERQALQMALDLRGIACSTGSACASGSGRPSPVLTAMGLSQKTVAGSLRFSFSRFTCPEEVQKTAEIVSQVVCKLRSH